MDFKVQYLIFRQTHIFKSCFYVHSLVPLVAMPRHETCRCKMSWTSAKRLPLCRRFSTRKTGCFFFFRLTKLLVFWMVNIYNISTMWKSLFLWFLSVIFFGKISFGSISGLEMERRWLDAKPGWVNAPGKADNVSKAMCLAICIYIYNIIIYIYII